MEYLHRSLDKLKEVPNFNYHSKCKKLNIINLSFADDLLLFTRGNNNFIELVMRTFDEFYRSIWLKVNPSKCIVNFGGVDESGRVEIQQNTSFVDGHIPFKYLGIPLTSKKLTMH